MCVYSETEVPVCKKQTTFMFVCHEWKTYVYNQYLRHMIVHSFYLQCYQAVDCWLQECSPAHHKHSQ